jgi:hypothetical protein
VALIGVSFSEPEGIKQELSSEGKTKKKKKKKKKKKLSLSLSGTNS